MSHQCKGCEKMPIKGAWFQPRDRIFTQQSKYFSILKLPYDYALLALHILILYKSLRSKCLETIVIVLIGKTEDRPIGIVLLNATIHRSYYQTR